jgi:hypothetical protein
MAEGLLASLDSLLNTSDLSSLVGSQSVELNGIISSVQELLNGPTEFADLQGLIEAVPLPPGLEGIGNLTTNLSGLSLPSDFSASLAPLLTPLTGLSGTLTGGGASQAAVLFDMVREIIRLITGRVFGGASGMPAGGIEIPQLPDVAEFRSAIAQAQTVLDGLGPRLDAARILELLRSGSAAFDTPLIRWPNLPVIDETMEALQTVATWQTLPANQLNTHLARTIEMAAALIDTPRVRVAQPVLDAAQIVTAGANTLATAQTTLTEVFSTLRPKILTATADPSGTELRRVVATADALERLANAVHAQRSPLARIHHLDEDLTRSLLAVVRAIQPAYDIRPAAEKVQELLDNLPAAPADAFNDVTAAIDDFDLSAITGALQDVKNAVQAAVDEVNGAKETVRAELEALLSPVETALDNALTAAGFMEIQNALAGLPAEIQSFVDDQLTPVIEPLRQGIEEAVNTVSAAATTFNPQTLIAPIREAIEQVAALLNSDDVRGAFAEVEQVLTEVIQSLENFDLAAAADESISLIGEIEVKVADIDPASIPDAAKPLIQQAIKVVTDIEFTVEVSDPIVNAIQTAVVEGPQAVLVVLEEGVDEIRSRITQFKPSTVIGDQLDQPFRELIETLQQFKPSDLLQQLQKTLDGLAARLNVLDVEAIINPLVELHQTIVAQVEALRPSKLLEPVNAAIAAAIAKVYEVSGIDNIFDGINDVLTYIQSWTGLLADCRDLLAQAATLFSEPGDATAAVNALVNEAVAKLDGVDLSRLQTAFNAAGEAVRRIERDAIAGELARALQNAGQQGVAMLNSDAAQQVKQLIRSFPMAALRAHQPIPRRRHLINAMERLLAAADTLDAARQPWHEISPQLLSAAGNLQEALLDYYKVQQLNGGGVFAQFRNPPATVAALKEAVRAALVDSLEAPLTTVIMAFQAFSPYIELLARGFSDILDSVQAKIDLIVGQEGVGGAVNAVEEAANLLRDMDLSPITGPLDSLYGRIETALNALDPEPLRAVLSAARDAIGNLLQLSTLIDQTTITNLDNTYNAAVAAIGDLAPSEIIADTLDPVYEELLADFLPVLDLPARLRELTEAAGRKLGDEAVRELVRIEVAFDDMLRAIPLATGTASAQVSVSVSVG